jgi:hypothetical protein
MQIHFKWNPCCSYPTKLGWLGSKAPSPNIIVIVYCTKGKQWSLACADKHVVRLVAESIIITLDL